VNFLSSADGVTSFLYANYGVASSGRGFVFIQWEAIVQKFVQHPKYITTSFLSLIASGVRRSKHTSQNDYAVPEL
jgi:hypothetical protein